KQDPARVAAARRLSGRRAWPARSDRAAPALADAPDDLPEAAPCQVPLGGGGVETVEGRATTGAPRFVDNYRWPCQRISPPEGRRLPAPRRAPGILLKVHPTGRHRARGLLVQRAGRCEQWRSPERRREHCPGGESRPRINGGPGGPAG